MTRPVAAIPRMGPVWVPVPYRPAARVDDYLSELARELRRRHVVEGRIVDEVRHHLEDAVTRYLGQGMPVQEAQDHALQDLGSPRRIASGFASASHHRHLTLALAAVAVGALAAFVDSRPHWDDTGIVAGGIFLACLVLGLFGPRRAWLWALCCGLGVPLCRHRDQPQLRLVACRCVRLRGCLRRCGRAQVRHRFARLSAISWSSRPRASGQRVPDGDRTVPAAGHRERLPGRDRDPGNEDLRHFGSRSASST